MPKCREAGNHDHAAFKIVLAISKAAPGRANDCMALDIVTNVSESDKIV